jgi:prepilin-type N-terminal cleavage/methylation domain-containing protein
MNRPPPRPAIARAFTLTELLIAISVLTMLTAFVAQIVNSATLVTTSSRKHMDADSQGRLVFNRMAGDFGKMLRRGDVDYLFSKQTGNDKIFFYSEAPAYYDGGSSSFKPRGSVALVGYRINADQQFERLGKLLSWGGNAVTQPGSVVFLTRPAPTVAVPNPAPLPATLLENNWATTLGSAPAYEGMDDDYHVLAGEACRLEFCFLLKNGKYAFDPAGGTATNIHNLDNVRAIVVALVVLDAASQKIAAMSNVCAAFADPTAADLEADPPVLMAERWQRQLYRGDFVQATGIPQAAASQIRIYERHFSISPQ